MSDFDDDPPSRDDYAAPSPGTVLAGKFRIERVLGSGGMGVVAAAHHLQLGTKVAIKYLLPEALTQPEIVERFEREARVAAQIRSEHVARVIDFGRFDGQLPYLVLEYLEGEMLWTYLHRKKRLRISDAVRFVLQICEVLAEAHAVGIVHRDLKPENVFIAKLPDRRHIVKVLDFGISKIIKEPMTNPGRVLGTASYMSPEGLGMSLHVDHRADIWSLGVILFELLSGERPFVGHNILTIAESVKANDRPKLSVLCSDVPGALEEVVNRCLKLKPEERYESVLELAEALSMFARPRDQVSVRRIAGVLQGSLAPSSYSSGESPIVSLPPAPPIPRVEHTPIEGIAATLEDEVPPPRSSDVPVITPIESDEAPIHDLDADHHAPRLEKKKGNGYLGAAIVGIFAAAAGVLVAQAIARMPGPATQAPTSAASPAAEEFTLRVRSSPANAVIRIDDGPPLPLPLAQPIHSDGREHRLTFSADGYYTQSMSVRFTQDQSVVVSLAKEQE